MTTFLMLNAIQVKKKGLGSLHSHLFLDFDRFLPTDHAYVPITTSLPLHCGGIFTQLCTLQAILVFDFSGHKTLCLLPHRLHPTTPYPTCWKSIFFVSKILIWVDHFFLPFSSLEFYDDLFQLIRILKDVGTWQEQEPQKLNMFY